MAKERCKKNVRYTAIYQGGHSKRCTRYAVKDGYCKIHHPDAEYERGKKRAGKMPVGLWRMLYSIGS